MTRLDRRARRSIPGAVALLALLVVPGQVHGQQAPGFPHRVTDGFADLRNETVLEGGAAARERGLELLRSAADRQGYDAWRAHTTLEMVALDEWAKPGPWWPTQNQRIRLQQLLGTFTSRVELLDGPAEGESWGIQSWAAYRSVDADSPPNWLDESEDSGTLSFYLPTLHYFNELTFRLLGAPVVIHAGAAALGGRQYDLVFVTWGDARPHQGADQYVLWIGRKSGLVEKAHYTVREAAELAPQDQRAMMRAGAAGTIHFSDFRPVDGVSFPFRHVITLFGPEQADDTPESQYVHRLQAEEVSFDTVGREALVLDPERGQPADAKP